MTTTTIALPLLLALVSAIGFRVRGGFTVGGNVLTHTMARLAWALPVSVGAMLISGQTLTIVILPFLFAACTVPTFQAIDMGRVDGTLQRDAAFALLRGLIFSVAAALPLYVAGVVDVPHAVAILGIGIFMPIMYELGWRTPSKIRGLEQGSAIAEAYWGAFYGLALGAAVLR